nr:MAG TPA: hypothetical protein [Caudoviricetes sp.]
MGKKRETDRQQVKEWMMRDNIEANELMVSKIFERVKYFEKYKNVNLQKAYIAAHIEYMNMEAENLLK